MLNYCEDSIFIGKNQRFAYIRIRVQAYPYPASDHAAAVPAYGGTGSGVAGGGAPIAQGIRRDGHAGRAGIAGNEHLQPAYGFLRFPVRPDEADRRSIFLYPRLPVFPDGRGGFTLDLHIGAGGTLGYAFDYEKGYFSSYDRELSHTPGGVIALNCDVGLRVDFRRRLTLDLSFNLEPGIHMRTDPSTGALLLSFYKNGIYRGYYPQLNLLYRF